MNFEYKYTNRYNNKYKYYDKKTNTVVDFTEASQVINANFNYQLCQFQKNNFHLPNKYNYPPKYYIANNYNSYNNSCVDFGKQHYYENKCPFWRYPITAPFSTKPIVVNSNKVKKSLISKNNINQQCIQSRNNSTIIREATNCLSIVKKSNIKKSASKSDLEKKVTQISQRSIPTPFKPKVMIVPRQPPKVKIARKVKFLDTFEANPNDFVKKYGTSLKTTEQIPTFYRD